MQPTETQQLTFIINLLTAYRDDPELQLETREYKTGPIQVHAADVAVTDETTWYPWRTIEHVYDHNLTYILELLSSPLHQVRIKPEALRGEEFTHETP